MYENVFFENYYNEYGTKNQEKYTTAYVVPAPPLLKVIFNSKYFTGVSFFTIIFYCCK